MHRRLSILPAALLGLAPAPGLADVAASGAEGFVSHNEVLVRASPQEAWEMLLRPAQWWSGDHSYSGDAANLTLEPIAGGCFCEKLPASGGAVEHMRVIHMAPGSTLRMSGALGPLQSEAVTGVLTATLSADGEMTRITFDYVVGGYSRMPLAELAPAVDGVIGEQLLRLAARLGRQVDPAPRRP